MQRVGQRPVSAALPPSVEAAQALLCDAGYVAERGLATVVFLALRLPMPLFLEGEAGVGKTEVANALARVLGRRLIRLQCYEGLDIAAAVYEWNYPRQMLGIRLAEAAGEKDQAAVEQDIYSERYLIKRPLLQALEPDPNGAPVLLIDEVDRADAPFEAYLLEMLADYRISIPELGAVAAADPPIVVLTSNRTREVHDALKRRCLYHWLDFPDARRERAILATKVPHAGEALVAQVVAFVQALRGRDLFKQPGVAETVDWLQALLTLDVSQLGTQDIRDTGGALLKYQEDVERLDEALVLELLEEARVATATGG